jgi:hypothetical protein
MPILPLTSASVLVGVVGNLLPHRRSGESSWRSCASGQHLLRQGPDENFGQVVLIDDHDAEFDWLTITRTLIDTIPWPMPKRYRVSQLRSRVFFTYACDSIGCHQHNPSLQGMNTRGSFPSGTAFPFAMHKTRCQHHNRRVANNFAPKLQLFHINSAEHTGTPMTWNQTSELKLAWLCEVPDNLVRFLRR